MSAAPVSLPCREERNDGFRVSEWPHHSERVGTERGGTLRSV
jgi:hypothetical protein